MTYHFAGMDALLLAAFKPVHTGNAAPSEEHLSATGAVKKACETAVDLISGKISFKPCNTALTCEVYAHSN